MGMGGCTVANGGNPWREQCRQQGRRKYATSVLDLPISPILFIFIAAHRTFTARVITRAGKTLVRVSPALLGTYVVLSNCSN
jgi:hypothetical protein